MSRRPPPAPAIEDARVRRQPLPGVLGRIERAYGYPLAEAFALAFGGQEIYIPRRPPADHPIARTLGVRNARAIGRLLGPDELGSAVAVAVPLGETELKWNIARRLRLAGMSRNEIVRSLRETYRLPASAARVGDLCRDLPAPAPRPRPAGGGAPRPAAPAALPLFEYASGRD